jgi:hypothetical protein
MKVAAAAAVETAAMVGAAAVAAMETASVINAACVAGAAIDAATIDASTIEASAVDASAVIPASAIIAAAAIIGVAAIAIAVGVVRRDVAGCRVNARRLASRERHCESRDDRAEKNPTATQLPLLASTIAARAPLRRSLDQSAAAVERSRLHRQPHSPFGEPQRTGAPFVAHAGATVSVTGTAFPGRS